MPDSTVTTVCSAEGRVRRTCADHRQPAGMLVVCLRAQSAGDDGQAAGMLGVSLRAQTGGNDVRAAGMRSYGRL